MTFHEWEPLFGLFCAGLERKPTPAQARAYFDALEHFPRSVVSDAVNAAKSRTWPPFRPNAGDLAEVARSIHRGRLVPAKACDVCHGSTWTKHHCTPETPCGAQHPSVERVPIYHPNPKDTVWIERPYFHDYAKRCYQCWQPMDGAA